MLRFVKSFFKRCFMCNKLKLKLHYSRVNDEFSKSRGETHSPVCHKCSLIVNERYRNLPIPSVWHVVDRNQGHRAVIREIKSNWTLMQKRMLQYPDKKFVKNKKTKRWE